MEGGLFFEFEAASGDTPSPRLSQVREELGSEFKLQLHERATARGLDDPCKADYSRFLKTVKKKQRSAVIPLEHGP